MKLRHLAVGLCLSFGCQGILTHTELSEPAASPAFTQVKAQVAQPASRKSTRDVANSTPLPVAPLNTGDDALALAAACIEKGDTAGAAEHLRQHVRQFPDQIMIRAYLAEMFLKMNRLADAREQFERFIVDAQSVSGPAHDHLVHCHTRLMEIAQQRSDAYEERLHRGIGMVLLARRLEAGGEVDEAECGFRERMLCKAAAELTAAKKLRPDESRPHWYLVEVWTRLGQPRAAENSLKKAKALATFMPLPRVEQSALIAER